MCEFLLFCHSLYGLPGNPGPVHFGSSRIKQNSLRNGYMRFMHWTWTLKPTNFGVRVGGILATQVWQTCLNSLAGAVYLPRGSRNRLPKLELSWRLCRLRPLSCHPDLPQRAAAVLAVRTTTPPPPLLVLALCLFHLKLQGCNKNKPSSG